MLGKIANLGGLLGPKVDHPLADAKELRRVLAELPLDNAFKSLDEIAGWLESLQNAAGFPAGLRFEVVRQLDEAAQPHLRRLGRDYLLAPRLSRTEEKRLWTIIHDAWERLAANYEACLGAFLTGEKLPDSLRSALPLLCARLIAALGTMNKWDYFHYGPFSATLWARLGQACLVAESAGVAETPLQLYSQQTGSTSVDQEYLKAMVFEAASLDALMPIQIELAEKLIANFLLPKFVFGPVAQPDSVYWVDLGKAQPPMRLARMPRDMNPSLRFFQPGSAHADLKHLAEEIKARGEIPHDLNLGGQYQARTVLPVLEHLAAYLAPVPPQRRHDRHRVKHRMMVVGGLANASAIFSGGAEDEPVASQIENWVVENVSLGGFGGVVNTMPAEWLKVGALLALQPEGGDNWLLGIVRRCRRDADIGLRVGIQSLARQPVPVVLESGRGARISALWIQEGNEPGEMRFVLPPASFDPREGLALDEGGQHFQLLPVALVEQTPDYEVARYRATIVG